ncbi:nucleotide exchange factor GrpE [Buchnera aphidicola]|uniref:Protein GrpE n=1 Tax=Buchnera aphidicola (Anoecia oenotherae) TaxID=1241833 RepID=A0A4D6XQK8_9GAMM|nr:nucleotide exchange factor GrpE [Buchnera aphidicola]QCI19283.1 nucleotide exchange factor GrpE [Buchnera aphidicola (Anoecia oenotherae)]
MNEKNKKTSQNKNFLKKEQDQKILEETKDHNESIIDEIDNIKNVKYTLKNVDEIQKKIFNIKKEIKNLNLRHQANIENFEKKIEIELLIIKNEYLKRFFLDFFSVLDLLDNILCIVKKDNTLKDPIIEGIVLTRNLLLKCLFKFGLKKIEVSKNSFFDHKKHEVNNYLDIKDKGSHHIYDVIKTGYLFNNEILRKSRVNVVK